MNPKRHLLIQHNENVIEKNTPFVKMMQPPPDAYTLRRKIQMENPASRFRLVESIPTLRRAPTRICLMKECVTALQPANIRILPIRSW